MREKLEKERDRTQWLDDKEVIRLLKAEVDRAGSQTAFAKQTGANRNNLNRILGGKMAITTGVARRSSFGGFMSQSEREGAPMKEWTGVKYAVEFTVWNCFSSKVSSLPHAMARI